MEGEWSGDKRKDDGVSKRDKDTSKSGSKPAAAKTSAKAKPAAKGPGAVKTRGATKPDIPAAVQPAPSRPSANPIELPEGMWERIAQKAYELYEQRGRGEGRALEDWLKAEEIVMEEIHEARE